MSRSLPAGVQAVVVLGVIGVVFFSRHAWLAAFHGTVRFFEEAASTSVEAEAVVVWWKRYGPDHHEGIVELPDGTRVWFGPAATAFEPRSRVRVSYRQAGDRKFDITVAGLQAREGYELRRIVFPRVILTPVREGGCTVTFPGPAQRQPLPPGALHLYVYAPEGGTPDFYSFASMPAAGERTLSFFEAQAASLLRAAGGVRPQLRGLTAEPDPARGAQASFVAGFSSLERHDGVRPVADGIEISTYPVQVVRERTGAIRLIADEHGVCAAFVYASSHQALANATEVAQPFLDSLRLVAP